MLSASGGIGQPLSLLLKLDPLVSSLSLYDIRLAPGVTATVTVSHVDTPGEVKGYPADKLDEALDGVKVVVIPAGVPHIPGMTRDDLFNTNRPQPRRRRCRVSPEAHVLIISNPVNSTIPIGASVFETADIFNPRWLFGVTMLDVVRAAHFVSGVANIMPADVLINVVGGYSGVTIGPLLSQNKHGKALTGEVYEKLIHFGGDDDVLKLHSESHPMISFQSKICCVK